MYYFKLLFIINIVILLLFEVNIKSIYLTCIVVRINNPTSSQISRYLKWRRFFPSRFNFYLLSMKNINLSKSSMINVVVSFDEIKYKYPNISKLKGSCKNFNTPQSISWISHSESLIVFYKKIKLKHDYMWIIEQDVGFVGNLYNFIKIYENNKKDLITFGFRKITPKWLWFYCATEKYITRRYNCFNDSYGYSNREYIQRWSKLYIKEMMNDLQNNYHSQTESSTMELIFYHNLSYELIPKKFIGYPCFATKSLTEFQWLNISYNKRNSNKFFHPLKF